MTKEITTPFELEKARLELDRGQLAFDRERLSFDREGPELAWEQLRLDQKREERLAEAQRGREAAARGDLLYSITVEEVLERDRKWACALAETLGVGEHPMKEVVNRLPKDKSGKTSGPIVAFDELKRRIGKGVAAGKYVLHARHHTGGRPNRIVVGLAKDDFLEGDA